MIGNKYSSFAVLRKNQIEQLETRRAVRNRSNTLDNQVVSVLRTDQDGTMETKKETLNAFLTSRSTKVKKVQVAMVTMYRINWHNKGYYRILHLECLLKHCL